jgi:inner membrane protein
MRDAAERFAAWFRGSQMLRLLGVGLLALLLLIPIGAIRRLVFERQQRRDEAIGEVSSKWGTPQSITGPALVVPYAHRWTEASGGGTVTRSETRHAIFLPEDLRIRGTLDTEVRHRGIFSVPVYKLTLDVAGTFARPRPGDLGIDPAAMDWNRAHLAVGISDARAIQEARALSWNRRQIPFVPGTGGFTDAPAEVRPIRGDMTMATMAAAPGPASGTGIHAPLAAADTGSVADFSFSLLLNGSLGVDVAPFGQTTVVEIDGDHGHPSFQGNWLPAERTVSSDRFRASWSISFLGRNYPQAWTSETPMGGAIGASRFGVELVDPVDHYRMAARSVKYAGLFILLTFAAVWLIEVLAGVRVHPIQYLMLGGALCLFYLLELSLSEHVGFPVAYALASILVVAMVGAYSAVILRRRSRALFVAAGVAVLYAYLYLLLMNEDYALLIGSVGLFAVLAAIMFATRRVDWYSAGGRPSRLAAPEE